MELFLANSVPEASFLPIKEIGDAILKKYFYQTK